MKWFLGCFHRFVNEEEMPKIQIDLELCDGCVACVKSCPTAAIEILET